MSLQGKHIVLGITGSIAAYKSATLIRLLIKMGAEVQVVITPSGKEFITPLTLSTLTQKPVVSEFFDRRDGSWHSHVSLGLWADLMLIAPASAATLAKMVTGVADNMLLTTYLSMKAPVWVAPAMDLDMYRHPATQSNLQTLRERGVHVVEPGDGFLASGLEGKGRMEEPEQIAQAVADFFEAKEPGCKEPSLAGMEVLITSGPSSLPDPQGMHVERVSTACEMLAACQKVSNSCRLAIFSAAVADYRPEHKAEGKMKRESTGASMSLSLVKNPDIAATLGAEKKENQIMVGFALETSSDHEEARRKMARKGMDLMVLNSINDRGAGFGTPTNKVTLIPQEGEPLECSLKSKEEVAKDILNYLTNHYLQQ